MTRLSRHLLWIAAAAPVMAGVELGRRIFANNDDARFAVLAQDVFSQGLRFFPELNGAPYYNKPALLAWLMALVSWPGGDVTQLTAALPSAAAGVATAVAFYMNRRVVAVETNAELDRVMSSAGPAVAIMTEGALASSRERFAVLVNDRLALRSVSLVRKE